MGGDYDFRDTDPAPADVRHAKKVVTLLGIGLLIAGIAIVVAF